MIKYIFILIVLMSSIGQANPLGIVHLSNELSLFKNVNDDLDSKGFTAQLVSMNLIHSVRMGFVLDWNFDDGNEDNYWELGLTLPIKNQLSFSYQRVNGTFIKPNNQFGLTWRF